MQPVGKILTRMKRIIEMGSRFFNVLFFENKKVKLGKK
jgi:hypothetical protein